MLILFDLKINKARINHRGELELYGRNSRGYFIKYVKGDFSKILEDLENSGIKVERDVLIFI